MTRRSTLGRISAGLVAAVGATMMLTLSCGGKEEKPKPVVGAILSQAHYKRVVDEAGDMLLVLDLYADWCKPCRMLSPLLEDIARTYAGRVAFYKINVDNNPGIAQSFGVSGIPLVVFVRKRQKVHSLMGVQPRETYVEAIEKFRG